MIFNTGQTCSFYLVNIVEVQKFKTSQELLNYVGISCISNLICFQFDHTSVSCGIRRPTAINQVVPPHGNIAKTCVYTQQLICRNLSAKNRALY